MQIVITTGQNEHKFTQSQALEKLKTDYRIRGLYK